MTNAQILFATFLGVLAIVVTVAPAIAVILHFYSKKKQEHDDISVISMLFAIVVVQFLVTVFFYFALEILNTLIKINNVSILGAGGMLSMFWTTKVSYSSTFLETWTTIITMIRGTFITINAFLPFLFVFAGAVIGYAVSTKTKENPTHDHYMMAVRIFLSIFASAIAYNAFSQFGMYSLQIQDQTGNISSLADAAHTWWKSAVGISAAGGKTAL